MIMSIPTTQVAVLDAVIQRLIAEIPSLTPSTCFLSLDPEPTIALSSQVFVTVAPLGGQFDQGVFDGHGAFGILEHSGVLVSAWSSMRLDQNEHAAAVLSDESRGLLVLKQRILKALAGHDLQDADGNSLLTALMEPRSAQHPQRAAFGERHVGFTLAFATPFDWDIGAFDQPHAETSGP
jgi:hypothetical protein